MDIEGPNHDVQPWFDTKVKMRWDDANLYVQPFNVSLHSVYSDSLCNSDTLVLECTKQKFGQILRKIIA